MIYSPSPPITATTWVEILRLAGIGSEVTLLEILSDTSQLQAILTTLQNIQSGGIAMASGAATAALQQAANTLLAQIALNTGGGPGTHINVQQEVIVDPGNSSSANIAAGATFTGVGADTLGVNAIQVSLYTTQNCTVRIDQSPDNINWDLTDTYNYYASIGNFGLTVQAISSYVRIRVTNTGTLTTTSLRLQTVLCPIVEAVPRSLDLDGNFKVAQKSTIDRFGFLGSNTPQGNTRVADVYRLVGAQFDGTGAVDPNFWLATPAVAGGTATLGNAQVVLATTVNAASGIQLNSTRRARYVSGVSLKFRTVLTHSNTGVADNTRTWGVAFGAVMPTITDGAFFELLGTTFNLVTLRAGVRNVIPNGTLNGLLGATYTLTTTNTLYEIVWTNSKVYFIVNDVLLHTWNADAQTWAGSMSHHVYLANINSGNNTIVTMSVRQASISRLGPLNTSSTYRRLTGAATTVLKYSPGTLHRVILASTGGTSIQLYDNTAAGGTVIALLTTGAIASIAFDTEFYNGLTAVTVGAGCDITIIYE